MKKKDIKILLVDDEPDVIEIIKYNLEQDGYNVKTASNGKEALMKAKKITPHLIIMDVMMPEMDGIEACENLRSDKIFNDTIIMFLTARGEDYSHMAAFDAGADDYVTKPIKPKVIVSKVKALLRRLKKEEGQDKIKVGKLKIDKEQYEVTHKGKTFSLPRKEFELLFLFTIIFRIFSSRFTLRTDFELSFPLVNSSSSTIFRDLVVCESIDKITSLTFKPAFSAFDPLRTNVISG